MNAVAVVGGVYGEECAFPLRKQVFGSAGRAAVSLSKRFESVTLHTTLPEQVAKRVLPNFDAYGVNVKLHGGNQFISFEYLHCLADPQIHPRANKIEEQASFHIKGDLVIQFGMMECDVPP
jgi:hypothetical protein